MGASAPAAPALSVRGLTRRFGGLTAVNAVDLDLVQGELVSIIGPNGAGKTTLFNLVTGLDAADAGEVLLSGQAITGFSPERLAGLGVARTFQLGRVFAQSERHGQRADRRAHPPAGGAPGRSRCRAAAGARACARQAAVGEGRGGSDYARR